MNKSFVWIELVLQRNSRKILSHLLDHSHHYHQGQFSPEEKKSIKLLIALQTKST